MQYQWQFDAPTGTFKNHAMSQRLYLAALEKSVFMDFTQGVEGFGRKKGESITLTRIKNIVEPTSVDLIEGERIPEDQFAISTVAITVKEIGRAVPYTSLSEDLSFYNQENQIQRTLRDQMRLALDTKAAAAFKTAKVKYVPDGATSNTITTNGTPGAAASVNMNVFHVEEIRDYLFDTLHTPMMGDTYVGIFRTLGLRGIKRDTAWEQWYIYTNPQAKFNSEVGKLEEIRFVETNHANALGKIGTSSVLGEGVVFGEDAVALAEVLTPELRAAIPDDYGRSKGVAWYGILELGLIWDTGNAGEARVIHVSST